MKSPPIVRRATWRKLVKLSRLSGRERRLLVSAFFRLLAVDLTLRTMGFARARRWLGGGGAARPPEPPGAERWPEVERVAWAVGVAAAHHLYPMRCLARSLAIQGLLARRGVGCELRIGVRKDETGTFRAHAWIECQGRAVTEAEGIEERYAPLALPPG